MPDRQQAFEDLKMFNQFCKRHNIFFWLDGGTLLGAIREGTFIPWEGDIDLATPKGNLDIIYKNRAEFEQLGYKIFPKQQGYAIIGKNLSSKLDIYSYTFDDEFAHLYDVERNTIGNLSEFLMFVFNQYDADYKYETTVSVNITKKFIKLVSYLPMNIRKKTLMFLEKLFWSFGVAGKTISNTPKEFFSKFKEIKFYGDVFNVPFETEKYLIEVYGNDWREPKIYSNDKNDSLYKWKAFKNVKTE
jgi:phosphorylcholine metabolism protein LicD